jgi:Ti-type conjugative transfer relaxase TraA
MLTIKKISGSQAAAEYYAKYASEKGETQGQWVDHSQELQSVGSIVEEQAMLNMLQGFSPDGKLALCQNPGEGHLPGWDLTFSPPKSVSIAWSNADDTLREKIEQVHQQAVIQSLGFLNDQAASVRVGKGGAEVDKANLVAALFQHSSNRAEEPQLHTHAIVFNVANSRGDGKWRTLNPYPIYRAYMAAGALYKAGLADSLKNLGFSIHRTKDSFELSQIPEKVCAAQSSRSKAIEQALEEQGLTRANSSAVMKEIVALDTRPEKGSERIVRDFTRWQSENTSYGFGPVEQAQSLAQQKNESEPEIFGDKEKAAVTAECLQKITTQASTFNEFGLYRSIAEAGIGKTNIEQIMVMVSDARSSSEVVKLGQNKFHEFRLSTREMVAIEQENMAMVGQRQGENKHFVPSVIVNQVLAERPTIREEQAEALKHVASGKDGVAFIEGDAGTGKSYLMAAVRDAYETIGYEVRGISFTNKAAKNLEEGSGIKNCQSVDSFLYEQDKGRNTLTDRTILVLDEAGMLDSRKMSKLLRQCKEQGSKLICVGDQKQIQPIAAGQAFGSMKRAFGSKRLSEIMRQREKWLKEAIQEFASGNVRKGLDEFDQRHSLTIADNRQVARLAIIDTWRQRIDKAGLEKAPLMVVTTNSEVNRLNQLARESLVQGGYLNQGVAIATEHGKQFFAPGDRIIFTSNDKKNGIYNSGVGIIQSLKYPSPIGTAKPITVKMENGPRVTFDPASFKSFRHAYAITAHKSQGTTVDQVLVLVDSSMMDREKFYVAISRGKANPQIFADRQTIGDLTHEDRQELASLPEKQRHDAEQNLLKASLARILGSSHEKDTSQDYPLAQSLGYKETAFAHNTQHIGFNNIKSKVFDHLRILQSRIADFVTDHRGMGKGQELAQKDPKALGKDVGYEV